MPRRVPLRTQLLWLQVLIVTTAVVLVGVVATMLQAQQIRDSYEQQMAGVARSVATLPSVVAAYDDADPAATIQPIAELIRQASGVTYVVLTDDRGIRYSHPEPDRIGERVSTDPSAVLAGATFVGTETGTLGESWRVKLPVRDEDGAVIGTASVGILESELQAALLEDLPWLVLWLVGAALLGVLGAAWVSRLVWRRIHRLEPEQIAALLEVREAMLHGIGEGVLAVDERDRVSMVNDQAADLLGLTSDPEGLVARPAAEVLEPSLLALLNAEAATSERMLLVGERVLLGRRTEARVDGERVGTVLVLRDRTELERTMRELDGARDTTQALRAQAHEFSNRMHVVSGLIEMGRTDDAVDFIARAGHGGAVSGGMRTPGILAPDVAALLMAKTASSEERGITLAVDPTSSVAGPDGAGADGEAEDLITVLGNLIDNAVDASPVGGTVTISLQQDHGGIRLVVEDEGSGVRPQDRERIFETGWSTKDDQGTRGIGLALARRVARRRAGDVTLGTAASGGARFEAHLGTTQVAVTAGAPTRDEHR
ncbi:sensor histidine kinase [Nocardioidaceae bacterium]|nr:sensor histidine kinase [Nocardioidaceae bacterium]